MSSKNPYRFSLKSRIDIINFLTSYEHYLRGRWESSPLAWNVKAYGVDLSFEHLIDVYRTSGDYSKEDHWLDYPEFLVPALDKFKEVEDDLWSWGREAACDQVSDPDAYRSLWDGKLLDVEYGFAGRSGGWLLMLSFQGHKLQRMERYEFEDWLGNIEFSILKDLYKLVVQNDHDFRREAVEREIEYQATFTFFENICGDVPRPEKTQLTLPI